jgi:hypothetical protein
MFNFKVLKGNIGKRLHYEHISNDFLSRTQIAQATRARTDGWDCIILKSFWVNTPADKLRSTSNLKYLKWI